MAAYDTSPFLGANLSGGGGISEAGYAVNRIRKTLIAAGKNTQALGTFDSAESPARAVETFLNALKAGVSSPLIGVLTEGSRYMAIEYHRSPGYQKNRYQQYQRSLPYSIAQSGSYAVALFAKNYARSIFLRADESGRWYVDETKMWAYADGLIKQDGDHYYVQTFMNPSPWSFALNTPGMKLMTGFECDRPRPVPLSVDLRDLIQKLEKRAQTEPLIASAWFDLADVYFFENYWIKDAIEAVEKGLLIDPTNERYLRRAIFFGSKMPDYRYTPAHFQTLLELHPSNLVRPDPFRPNIEYYANCFKKSGADCVVVKTIKGIDRAVQ